MKATIDEHGTLTVQAETPLESYALRCWGENCIHQDGETVVLPASGLLLNLGEPPRTPHE